ncbi:hypothetical protein [Enterovibrio norvegicus]|uniref:hypothetical protein n=1 Tax=Enterovibrio norvegicus TaxID=188144 RepID=UPI000C8485C5|nr:hypothetical protein [Enterovibrio norvegicus]PMH64484.1 hypothetical protein BCU62_15630 [Enterovibrio norvegicus]
MAKKLGLELVIEVDSVGIRNVVIDGVNFGVFDDVDMDGVFSFHPRRNDKMTGDHWIAVGEALNELNGKSN